MKTAILIPCYNRPDCLAQVLADVISMPQVRMGMPVFLACDGGDNASIAENVAAATSVKIPCLHALIRPQHLGVGRNVYDAKRHIFEECEFDQVFYVEDDIRLSPHTMTLLLNLQKWVTANYSNACVFSTATFCTMSLEEKQANLACVADCGYSLSNHLMTREGWNLMRPWMHEYVSRFLQCPYRERDNEAILAWVRTQAQKLPVQCGNRMMPVHWDYKAYFLEKPVTSQDGAMALALRLAGFSHVVTRVNRAWHIGKLGENATEEWWDKTFGTTRLDVFEDDNTRTDFRITL